MRRTRHRGLAPTRSGGWAPSGGRAGSDAQLGGRQLRFVVAEYADHYDVHRLHRALGQVPPLGPSELAVVVPAGRVARRGRLGGLLHEYSQVA
jgi:putative transposase